MSDDQLLRALEASLKAWDAAERAAHARFKAETDALRSDFNRALAALGAPPVIRAALALYAAFWVAVFAIVTLESFQ